MNNLKDIEQLAIVLNEPFDLESDLYNCLMDKLSSPEGILIPKDRAKDGDLLHFIDDISKIEIRGNLDKIPLSKEENLFKEVVDINGHSYFRLKLQNKDKNIQREIAEIIEGFKQTASEYRGILNHELANKVKNEFIELLANKKFDLAAERLELFKVKIEKIFDFYTFRYENLDTDLQICNVYVLRYVIDNFFKEISNQELLNPPLNYLFKISEIKDHLERYNIWLG